MKNPHLQLDRNQKWYVFDLPEFIPDHITSQVMQDDIDKDIAKALESRKEVYNQDDADFILFQSKRADRVVAPITDLNVLFSISEFIPLPSDVEIVYDTYRVILKKKGHLINRIAQNRVESIEATVTTLQGNIKILIIELKEHQKKYSESKGEDEKYFKGKADAYAFIIKRLNDILLWNS